MVRFGETVPVSAALTPEADCVATVTEADAETAALLEMTDSDAELDALLDGTEMLTPEEAELVGEERLTTEDAKLPLDWLGSADGTLLETALLKGTAELIPDDTTEEDNANRLAVEVAVELATMLDDWRGNGTGPPIAANQRIASCNGIVTRAVWMTAEKSLHSEPPPGIELVVSNVAATQPAWPSQLSRHSAKVNTKDRFVNAVLSGRTVPQEISDAQMKVYASPLLSWHVWP
ncbi:hypothetical protein AMS68_003802 [Peltaster fructicola]|uniref:Uncharacterized protein n=1 Tax=Peltaster fructicola TaxID=286661 RepID=A0A6H0XUF5_9PEZI|nr:hypothetical protein AMS68_003802 [Peltaster fructicola]